MRIDGRDIPKMEMAFTEEELKYLTEARKKEITYDEDSPETTPERAVKFRRGKASKAAVNN